MRLHNTSFRLIGIDVWPLRAPIRQPRRNAFGTMKTRPGLLAKIQLDDGVQGWGEVFANWPEFGLYHRARILRELIAPLIIGQTFSSPADMMRALSKHTHRMMLQSGEVGPFSQCIAGVDIALWDALSRREQVPAWHALGGAQNASVRVYASGITHETMDAIVPPLVDAGWSAFKLKVGFGVDQDRRALDRLRVLGGTQATLMVDANQAWTPEQAEDHIQWMEDYDLAWIEEPVTVDTPVETWASLAKDSATPLAGGENLRGHSAFASAMLQGGLSIIQPDPIKWGGLTACAEIADLVHLNGKSFAPHYLSGAVGLAATQALALAKGACFLEMDVTENPLRDDSSFGTLPPVDGRISASDRPGIGATPRMGFLQLHSAL